MTAPSEMPVDHLGALVVGPDELVAGYSDGPLAGTTGVVKDLFDIAGHRTGAGNPAFLADAGPAARNATAVDRMAAAGVTIIGKSITDELAYSLSGTNVHYGTPVNSAAPGRVPGGSSSGSASAVGGGLVDVALGTDTGGSVRVPSSWCGLFGIRPTHGRIPVDGLVPLAPSSDTVGWVARTGTDLADLGAALLDDHSTPPDVQSVLVAEDLFALTDDDVAVPLRQRAEEVAEVLLGRSAQPVTVVPADDELDEWFRGYRLRQQWEAWQSHGDWITRRQPAMGPGIRTRFAAAAATTRDDVAEADRIRSRVRARIDELVGDATILVVPVTMGPAAEPSLAGPAKDRMRARILAVNSLAGSTGSPTVVVPGVRLEAGPVGLGLFGHRGSDVLLLGAAARLDDGLTPSGRHGRSAAQPVDGHP